MMSDEDAEKLLRPCHKPSRSKSTEDIDMTSDFSEEDVRASVKNGRMHGTVQLPYLHRKKNPQMPAKVCYHTLSFCGQQRR